MSGEATVPFEVWRQGPSPQDTYFDRPVLKEPVWIWAVPAYFYAGGVAGAAATLGAAAQVVDRQGFDALIRRSRRMAVAGCAAGTALLIHDLGRRERFLNMLRVFRPSSPMSVGSWILTAATPAAGLAAALGGRRGRARSLGDVAGMAAGLLGPPLAGYTAVLLSTTAVPMWREAGASLPALFQASAASSAACLLELTPLGEREDRAVYRFGLWGKLAELAAALAVEREVSRVPRVALPLRRGVSGALWQASKVLTAASALLSLGSNRGSGRRVASSLLGTAGALGVRFAVFHAGKASARDPRATFEPQRSGRTEGGGPVTRTGAGP